MRIVLIVVACAFAVGACSTITSVGEFYTVEPMKTASGFYNLPRTIINLKVTTDVPPAITVTAATEADPESSVLYQITHSPLADDTIDVKTGLDGLLTSVTSTAVDRTGDIAADIAKLIFTTATDGATLPTTTRALPTGAALTGYAASYDPFNEAQAWTVRKALLNLGFCILIGDEVKEGSANCGRPPIAVPIDMIGASYASNNPGIYYRRLSPHPIQIFQRTTPNKSWNPLFTGNELFFDKSVLYRVDVDRAAFVTKKISLTFQSGVLTEINVSNPSEILGGLDAAVQVAQIIFAIPLSGLQQQKTLTDAQTNLLNSQASMIKAQQSLISLETTQSTNGRTLSFTPNYSLAGRSVQIPFAGIGTSDPDTCVRMWGLTRQQCLSAINSDANH
jgi:hypothetical protein